MDRRDGTGPLEPGLEADVEERVTEETSAAAVGSGDVRVLSTPALLALVERAAVLALADRLPPAKTSVGAAVELAHLAPTPIGAVVRATVRLDRVEGGRRLTFAFTVTDPAGEVGRGTHVRVVVDREAFEATAAGRNGDTPAALEGD